MGAQSCVGLPHGLAHGRPAFRTIYVVGPDLPKPPPCWCNLAISRWVAGGSNLAKGQVDSSVNTPPVSHWVGTTVLNATT